MRAARYHDREDVRVERSPNLTPGPTRSPSPSPTTVCAGPTCTSTSTAPIAFQSHRGHCNLFRRLAFHGVMAHRGRLAERSVVPASMVHRLPDEVDLDLGALVEPMAVTMHAVRRLPDVDHYRTDGWVEHVDLDDVVLAGFEPMATGRSKKILVDIGEAA
jgi:hypothetical protein